MEGLQGCLEANADGGKLYSLMQVGGGSRGRGRERGV